MAHQVLLINIWIVISCLTSSGLNPLIRFVSCIFSFFLKKSYCYFLYSKHISIDFIFFKFYIIIIIQFQHIRKSKSFFLQNFHSFFFLQKFNFMRQTLKLNPRGVNLFLSDHQFLHLKGMHFFLKILSG